MINVKSASKVCVADSAMEWGFDDPIKLVWTDPPFGTGKRQTKGRNTFVDLSPDDAVTLCCSAIEQMLPVLDSQGVICVCADDRIIHDLVYGLQCLNNPLFHQGDIVWTFGLGRPRTDWWPRRHNTIATFTTTENLPPFDKLAVPRELRKAPKPGYSDDKPAGSVWDYTMSNTDPERAGYPNQKPLAIIEPFVLAHTSPGDVVADPFMGSGSTGVAALRHGRRFRGQDLNPKAVKLVGKRLAEARRVR